MHDKQQLECFFRVLMDNDQFIYTLFADKAVSLSGDYTLTPYSAILSGSYSGGIFWKRWAVWKQIEKDLTIKNYLFIEEPAYNNSEGTMRFIFFVNKKAFLDTVNQHIQVFKDILGQDNTAVKLLKKIEQQKVFMPIFLGCNSALLCQQTASLFRLKKNYQLKGLL